MIDKEVIVIGAGLAGCEAAWQIANAGIAVKLFEMRPYHSTPAHHTSEFGELVCSNSFGALSPDRAAGLLQQELRIFNSLILQTADKFSVPAGGALAVDRSQFSKSLTKQFNGIKTFTLFSHNMPEKVLPSKGCHLIYYDGTDSLLHCIPPELYETHWNDIYKSAEENKRGALWIFIQTILKLLPSNVETPLSVPIHIKLLSSMYMSYTLFPARPSLRSYLLKFSPSKLIRP